MTPSKNNWNNWNWNSLAINYLLKCCKTTICGTLISNYQDTKGVNWDSFHQKSTLLGVKKVHYLTLLMLYPILCGHEGFSKNQSQHLIWRGCSNQKTYLDTKNGGISLQVLPREGVKDKGMSIEQRRMGIWIDSWQLKIESFLACPAC